MKIKSLEIENFRSFARETIYLDRYTCFVGDNGAGKSTVLTALNVFFRNNSSTATDVITLSKEDFHHRNTSAPIRITVTFIDFPDDAKEEFKHYVRQDQLVVTAEATWDEQKQSAEVQQRGQRLVMKQFAPYFEAIEKKKKVAEKKEIYAGIRQEFIDLPDVSTDVAMKAALRDYEESHPELCEIHADTHEFYGWSKGANRLAKYVQWIYIPAVKDASSEQDEESKTALGQLLQRTIRNKVDFDKPILELRQDLEKRYCEILEAQQDVLVELQGALESRLKNWGPQTARVDLNWRYDPKKSFVVNHPAARIAIGEGDFVGEVARLGHGMQRAFIVSVLQEMAGSASADEPTLILGFEEPELYQHPSQSQHIAYLLEDLTTPSAGGGQVVLTTHSPYFVSGETLEQVRVVKKTDQGKMSAALSATYEQIAEDIATALGTSYVEPTALMASVEQIMQPSQREMFFCRCPIFVEGVEDIAYLSSWLKLTERWSEFREHGCHFVTTDGKTNLTRPLAIANRFNIPAFVIFDSDGNDTNPKNRTNHRRDNCCILNLCRIDEPDPFPENDFWHDRGVMWAENATRAIREDFGSDYWSEAEQKVRKDRGLEDSKSKKNRIIIAATLEILHESGLVSTRLDRLSDGILEYARKSR